MAAATLDWSQCPAVESVPGKRSGAWVFRGTRTPVSMVFENLRDMSVDELVEELTRRKRRPPATKCWFCSITEHRERWPAI
jgi:hypothetical protein